MSDKGQPPKSLFATEPGAGRSSIKSPSPAGKPGGLLSLSSAASARADGAALQWRNSRRPEPREPQEAGEPSECRTPAPPAMLTPAPPFTAAVRSPRTRPDAGTGVLPANPFQTTRTQTRTESPPPTVNPFGPIALNSRGSSPTVGSKSHPEIAVSANPFSALSSSGHPSPVGERADLLHRASRLGENVALVLPQAQGPSDSGSALDVQQSDGQAVNCSDVAPPSVVVVSASEAEAVLDQSGLRLNSPLAPPEWTSQRRLSPRAATSVQSLASPAAPLSTTPGGTWRKYVIRILLVVALLLVVLLLIGVGKGYFPRMH